MDMTNSKKGHTQSPVRMAKRVTVRLTKSMFRVQTYVRRRDGRRLLPFFDCGYEVVSISAFTKGTKILSKKRHLPAAIVNGHLIMSYFFSFPWRMSVLSAWDRVSDETDAVRWLGVGQVRLGVPRHLGPLVDHNLVLVSRCILQLPMFDLADWIRH